MFDKKNGHFFIKRALLLGEDNKIVRYIQYIIHGHFDKTIADYENHVLAYML